MLFLCSLSLWSQEYSYPTYAQLVLKYSELVNTYPTMIDSSVIGSSETDNQPIMMYRLTNPNSTEISKKNILVIGSVYAKDIPAMNATYLWLKSFLQNADQTPYSSYADHFNIFIIPTLNPDGSDYVLNHSMYEMLSNTHDLNENNVFDYSSDGVNLNRNAEFNWIHGNEYNSSGNNQFFRGNHAYSENELIALKNVLTENKIEFCMINATESNQQFKVIFPYNWAFVRQSPDYQAYHMLGQNIASSIGNQWSTEPNVNRNGNLSDDMYVNYGIIPFSLSFDDYFVLPDSAGLQVYQDMFQSAAHHLMDSITQYNIINELMPGLLEVQVINSQNNQPMDAEIHIDQVNSMAFSNHKSNPENGKYYRYLNEGNYTLNINKKGFQPYSQPIVINNNQHLQIQVNLIPLPNAIINIQISLNNELVSGKIRIKKDHYQETILINGNGIFETFEGIHELTLISDELAPVRKTIHINPGVNQIFFSLDYTNHSFTEEFESSCCSWIMNGPWLVVSDSTHNSHFITDSWSGNGFYSVNANYSLQVSYPLSLFGYEEQDLYLTFDQAVHTEWDNDYVSVELSYDNFNWNSIYKFAGNTNGWEKQVISLNDFVNNDIYLRFRLKDGIEGQANHEDLVDPGWNIDNIRVIGSLSALNNQEIILQKPEVSKLNVYPNPFNPVLNISFESKDLIKDAEMKIFNIKGQLIKSQTLNSEQMRNRKFVWDAMPYASGIYFVQLIINNQEKLTKKTLLLK